MNPKNTQTFWILIGFFLFGLVFLPTKSAYAYLDPGSGSFIIQMIIAALVAVPFAFKGFWQKLGSLFKKKPKDNEDKDNKKDNPT